ALLLMTVSSHSRSRTTKPYLRESATRNRKPDSLKAAGKFCALANESLDDIDRGSRLAGEAAEFLDRRHQRIDLHRSAKLQILQHGRPMRAHPLGAGDAAVDIDAETGAELLSNRLRFDHHGADDRACSRIPAYLLERAAGERRHWVE